MGKLENVPEWLETRAHGGGQEVGGEMLGDASRPHFGQLVSWHVPPSGPCAFTKGLEGTSFERCPTDGQTDIQTRRPAAQPHRAEEPGGYPRTS